MKTTYIIHTDIYNTAIYSERWDFKLTLLYQSYNFPHQKLPRNHRTGRHGQVEVQDCFGLQSGVQFWGTFLITDAQANFAEADNLATWYYKLLDHELCLIILVCNQTSLSTFYLLIWIILFCDGQLFGLDCFCYGQLKAQASYCPVHFVLCQQEFHSILFNVREHLIQVSNVLCVKEC